MQNTLVSSPVPPPRGFPVAHGFGAAICAHPRSAEVGADDAFVAMLQAFRCGGGLARADEVAALLEPRDGPCIDSLTRWIVDRNVISFEWRAQTWLPWFQFNHPGGVPAPALAPVLEELNTVYDRWELANWFARPNSALADHTPVAVLATDPVAVLQAARADRFVANG